MPTSRFMRFPDKIGHGETTKDKTRARPLPGFSSAHFLKIVEDQGQIGFWTMDIENQRDTMSIGLYRVFGVDPSIQVSLEDLMTMIHPDDRSLNQNMVETLGSGIAINREFRIIRPDGTMRWIQNKGEVIVDAKGRTVRALGLLRDVTEQHEARISADEGWKAYKTLVSAISAMEWRMLSNGEIVCLAGWEQLTGQTANEAAGRGWLEALHPNDRETTHLAWHTCLANGSVYAVDHRIRCTDGQYRWFLTRAAPIPNPDGTIREWIGAVIRTVRCYKGATFHPDDGDQPLRAAHIRAARALLDWTIDDLASAAEISISSIRRLEAATGNSVRNHLNQAVRKAFERNGVSLESGSQGEMSVRFVQPR